MKPIYIRHRGFMASRLLFQGVPNLIRSNKVSARSRASSFTPGRHGEGAKENVFSHAKFLTTEQAMQGPRNGGGS